MLHDFQGFRIDWTLNLTFQKMASKRNMYRPAQVQENVGQRKPRKTLTQGRLITNAGLPQGTSQSSQPGSQNVSLAQNVSIASTSLVQGRLEESLFSPRRTVPQVSQPRTPDRGPRADSLDLSDSEHGEETSEYRSRLQKPDEILCIDASRQTVNPDMSEVDIRIGVDKSPVKIVCHSPSRLKHTLQQRDVSSPDTVRPKLLKENVRDDHIDPYTAVQALPMTPPNDRRVLQSLHTNLPQPNFSDSGDDRLDDKSSLHSDHSDVSSVKEYTVTNHKAKIVKKDKRAPPSAKKDGPETAKKKKGRIIPSRYKQAVDTKVKASLSARLDKSSFDRTNKVTKSMEAPPSVKKSARKTRRLNSAGVMERPRTPENQSIASSTGGKTSTPTMDGSHLSHDIDIDASAIHPDVSQLAGDMRRQYTGLVLPNKDLHDDLMGTSVLSNVSACNQSLVSSKPKQKPKQKVETLKTQQQKLDLLFMYNLQWAFLEAKAKKSLRDQEQQAMAQINWIHEEVMEMRKIKAEKEQKLARLKHINRTDHLVEVQRQCLGPVVSNLPKLEKQYGQLAYALDTTRHQIPTKDVYIPENEDQYLAKLENQLLESERVLGEISVVTGKDVPTIVDMGNAMVTMETAVEGMKEELKKAQELLSATETLTISECSLRVQDMQLKCES